MKKCTKCKETKDLTSFPKKNTGKGGLDPRCKKCKKDYDSSYRKKNREKLNASHREFSSSPEAKTKKKEYADNNKKKTAEYQAGYRAGHKEKVSEYNKMYRAGDAGRYIRSKSQQLRELRIRETSDGSITADSRRELFELQDGKCYMCDCDLTQLKKRNIHLDHILPLAKGGKHVIENVAWSCASCNLTKGSSVNANNTISNVQLETVAEALEASMNAVGLIKTGE